jgi:uncharacterized protein YggE
MSLRSLFAVLCLSAVFLAAPAKAQPSASPRPEPTIAVNGTGRVERAPDFVDVSLGVEVIDPSAANAQKTAEKTMAAVVEAVKALSLAGQDLQPGRVELEPRYEDRRSSAELPHVIGHHAAISLTVRTTDLQAPARIIDAALKAGATRVDSVSFGIREAISAREEAIRLAADAAKRKAKVLAESLDVRLGRVMNAGTTANVYSWGNRYSNTLAQRSAPAGPAGEDQGAIIPGKIEVWAEVNITYSIAEGGTHE